MQPTILGDFVDDLSRSREPGGVRGEARRPGLARPRGRAGALARSILRPSAGEPKAGCASRRPPESLRPAPCEPPAPGQNRPAGLPVALARAVAPARHAAAAFLVVFAALLAVSTTAQAQTTGICGRTAAVRTAILGKISGVSNCASVTDAHLADITGRLNLHNKGITALAAGDFDGLSGVTRLDLAQNSLTTLPAGVFDELTALTYLDLAYNSLTSLPAGVFDELTALTFLYLYNNSLSTLPDDVFEDLTALTFLWLQSNDLGTLRAGVFDELTALTYLRLDNNRLTTLPAGVFDELTALTLLYLYNNSLTTLPAGVFDELTALTQLELLGNSLTTLPAGVFDKLTALTELSLDRNSLSTLPAGVFDELTALEDLSLNDNSLTTLPAGVFEELTALRVLELYRNPGAPFSPTAVALPDNGEVSFAGGDVTLDGSDGGPWGTNVTYSWALTSPTSGVTVTFDDAASASPVVTIPALAEGTELTFTLTVTGRANRTARDTDAATVTAVFDPTAGIICGRTEQVRDAIVGLVSGVTHCANVTDAHLADITGTLNLGNKGITALAAGDFDGLTALTQLQLFGNSLSTLPDSVFDGLTALTTLKLNDNSLTTLPAGVFDELTALTTLWLEKNFLTSLPADVFDELTELTVLYLHENSLTSLPAGVFDELTALTTLWLEKNFLTSLPADVFDELTELTVLYLHENSLTTLPAGVFDELTALTVLWLHNNSLTTLPANVFAGLTALGGLYLGGNDLTTLPAGVFDGLTALVELSLNENELTTLDADVFNDQTALLALYLFDNALSTLPAGVFDGLTALTELYLNDNALSTLPDSVFDGLTALRGLYLNNNSLTTLPAGVFDELTALGRLELQDNPGAPFSPTAVALPDDGEVPSPGGTATLDGSGSGGGPWGTNLTYSWALTSPTSGVTVTFDDNTSATPVVTVPALAAGTELTFTLTVTGRATNTSYGTAAATDAAIVTAVASTAGICGRTQQVRDELLDLIEDNEGATVFCADVTDAHLAAIPDTLSLAGKGITALAAGDFAGLSGVTLLNLLSNDLTTLPDDVFDGLTALTGLSLSQNSLATLPAGVFNDLTALEALALNDNSLATLPAGVFDGLTALRGVELSSNSLTTLPAGVFDGLTALTELQLDNNSLTTLPAGVFDKLTALTELDLGENSLTTLPAGVFDELTALTTLLLQRNPGAPFSPTAVALPDDGTVSNAGGTVPLDGSGSDGGPWGTNVTYSWAASGATVTFDDAASATPVVTIPALTAGTELTFTLTVTGRATDASYGTAPDTDTAKVTVFGGICGRTAVVRTAILGKISGVSNCANVTDTHLAAITGRLNPRTGSTPLAAGDFDGLTALEDLDLDGNSLTSLPAGVFDGLTALTRLDLSSNELTTLPARVFDELTALTYLGLDRNSLTTLPAGVFDELTALTTLWLFGNSLSTLPAGVFDGLTALTELDLQGNDLTSLPAGVFDELTALTFLYLQGNDLTTLPAGVFDELTALTALYLGGNDLTTLPAGVFDELTALTELQLYSNSLTTLPAGVFDGLTALTELYLTENDLASLPAGVFDELTALTRLDLGVNSLGTLPAGVFEELTALTDLQLQGNSGAPFSPTAVAVPDDGTVSFAGGDVTLDGSGSGGPWGTNVTYSWATSGAAVTFDDAASATPVVTIPALAEGTELTFTLTVTGRATDTSRGTAPDTDNATVTAVFDATAGICGRTEQVRDAIVGLISGVTSCADVTDAHLADITGPLNLSNKGITALAAGDFDGLTALTWLYLDSNDLTTLPAGVFDELTALTTLTLFVNSLTTLPAGVFDGLTALPELQLHQNSLTTLPAGVFDELTALTGLRLDHNSLSTLPAGVFDKLTSLTTLNLSFNQLTTLPAGVFDKLTALTERLDMNNNQLSTLPVGVFDELTALTQLYLGRNDLASLPDDVFDKLISLTDLQLQGNSGAPFSPTADALPDDGTVLDAGGVVTLDGSGSDGGPWGTNVTYSWAASGAAVTFDDAASATPVVTIPALADGTELTFTLTVTGRATDTSRGTAPDTDTATVTAVFDPTAGICGRTEQVRDAIVALISGVTHCADVTDAHLAAITDQLNLNGKGITALAAGDFDGLTALTRLLMGYNSLTTLPAGVFDKLTALEALSLNNNSLTTLPAGVFDKLTALTERLDLFGNSLSTLPAGVFDELTALTQLGLNDNSLTTLPAGVFDELTALRVLYLNDNSLTTLPDDVFEELTALTLLWLYGNSGAPFSPTADALPDDGTVLDAGGTVTLDGSGSDGGPWGTNVTYSWAASGAAVTFDDAASATPVVTIPALAAGTELTFTLTVTGRATDTFRGTAPDTDTATVTATATNAAPAFTSSATFSAAENQTAAGTVEASDSDTGDSVTGYAIQGGADQAAFSIGAASGVLTFRSAPNFEDATDADASNTYVVVVRATSGTGARAKTEDQTITVTVTDVDGEAPGVPAAPTVSSASVSSVTAAWAAPANAGPPITDYDYRYRVKSTPGWTEVTNTTITALSTTITGLAEDTEYEVQVRATNDEGTSGWSDPGSASTDANAAPAFTSSATFSAAENQTAAGTVEASDSDTGDSVTGYAIQGGADRSKFSIGAASGVLTFRSAPNFEDATDADASNTYVVVVRATSGTGARAKTEDQTITVTVTDVDGEAPGVPAAPTVSSASVSSVTAAWAAPANAGPPITDYDYRYRVKSTAPGWTEVTNTPITALRATITGLAEDTEYEVQVRATNAEGTSDWSDPPGSGSTDANAAPAFTSSATVDAAENQTVAGTVEASDSDTGDSVTGYAIQGGADRSKFSIGAATGVLTFTSAPNFEAATDADTDNDYVVVVRATSGTGERLKTADQTITVTVTDEAGEAPGAPATPTVSSASVSSVTVTWAAPANAGPPITDYDYRYRVKTPQGSWTEVTNTTSTALRATITGLAEDTEYEVQVRATNAEGTSGWSDPPGSGSTDANAAPAFTSSATFDAAENQTAAGTVEASDSDAGDSVTGYAIQGGADQSAFSIGAASGVLTFTSAPNFEDATDDDASNTYVVVVRATSGTGERLKTADQTITVTVTDEAGEAPGVPAAPTVSSASVSSVTVTWAAPANAGPPITDYDYRYRVKSTPGWTEVTNTPITALGATIAGLAEDTEYEVQVRATNAEGTGDWSDPPGSGSTDANAAPSFTTPATVDAAENQTVAGTVAASDSDAGDSVTGYAIQGGADRSKFSIGAASGVLTFRSAPNFEDATDADASNTYEVVVRATSGTGARLKTADQTITVTVTDEDDEAPGVPAAPTVSSASVSSVTVAWAAPANAGPPITDYDYRYRVKTPQGSWTEVTNTPITALGATITGLAEDTEYEVQVRATNAEGTSDWSDPPGSGSTDANAAPAFTSSATVDAAENQTVAGTVAASDSDAGDSVTGYAIQGGADQSAFSIGAASGVLTFRSAPNFEDATDADASNTYVVVVRATSGTGARAKTADQTITVTVTDVDGEAPGVPAAPTVSSASVSSVTAAWAAPANAGPPITDYDYRYRVKSTPGWTEVTNTTSTALGATITGLAEDTEYEVQVRATNDEGTSGWSDPGSASTDANAAPAFTSSATFSAAENQTAAGTVEASDSDTGDSVTGYAIQGGADQSAFSIGAASGVLTFTSAPNFEAATDADTDNDYVVVVRATSGTGARAKTEDQTITVTVTDEAGEAPGVPAAPTVSSASVSSVTAAWAAPANAGPPITDYDYRYRVKSTPGWTEVTNTTSTALSATITGLAEDTEYEVQVLATNDEGTSGWSDPGSASTDANAAPAFTSSATFSAAENQTAAGTVEASDSDAGDSVTGYEIQGGADASRFTIVEATGVLTFRSAPNFEAATDADASNTYVVVVRATSGTGARAKTADQTITVTVTDVDGEAPGVPAAPTVSSASVSSVTAAWAAPANAGPPITDYDYRYQVKSTAPGWTEVTNTTITALSATITGLAEDTEYEVQVLATNDEGTSGWSDPGSASTDANAAPAFTSSATFSAAENQTAAGTVEASDSDTGDSVTGYAIQGGADQAAFSIGAASGVLTFRSAPNFEDATDADASNTYEVVVRATSGTGARAKTADQTITVTVTDVDGEAPGVPAAPTVSSASVSSVTAAWAAPANAGPPITDYDYRYRVKSTTPGWTEVTNTTITALSATITGLAEDTEYEVQVLATNDEGTSGWSDPGSASTDANAAPAFTSSATFSAAENQTAAGTVEASDSDTGDSVTGYAIQGGADQSAFSIGAASGVLTFRSAPNFEDATDADASNTYEVVVRATSGTGARAKTEDQTITVTVTDVDGEAPGVPAAPTVSSASVSSVTAAWAAPANAGPPITDYDYRYRVKSTTPGWTEVTNTTITALSATITGLAEDTEYEVQVLATNDEGTSGWSDPGSASTDANAAPAFTSSATFSAAENQTAAGTVEASDSDTGDSVTGYAIQGGADRSKFSIGAASGVLTFRSAPNFEAATDADTDNDYVVVVRATSGTGARAKTADQTITVTVTDEAGEAPGVPATPTVASASVSSVTVAWAAPANAGPPITDYDYRYRVKAPQGSWTEVTNTPITALGATIAGLAEDTEYEVQVRATNAEGTSDWSDPPGSASTDANAAPSFTTPATFDAAENQTVVGTVAASDSDAGDSVTGYAIQGGADQSAFSIGAASGVLTFRSAPNFEDATDDDASNTYVVVVRATSGTGARLKTADQTITVTVTDEAGEAPGAPATPTVSSASVSSVTVTWAAPANAGPPITDYDYRYRVKSTPGWTEVTNTPITALGATIAGLAEDTEYEVQVRATNAEGTSDWSDPPGSGSTDANAAPAFTSSATVDAAENQTVAGTVAASDSDAGDSVTGYAIQGGADRSKFSIGAASGVLTFRSAPNFEDATDDDASNTYVVVVRATSGTGARLKTADQTITVTVTDEAGEAPGVPAAPTVSSASVSSVTVTWAAPANAGPPITDYDYRYRVKSTPGWTEVTNTPITALGATIAGLAEDTEYEVQVRATNAEGTGDWSDPPGSGSTDANAAPSFTTPATVDAAENQTVAGTVAASDSDAGDSVTGYAIQGGADRSKFSIGAASGVLTFRSAPNFEDATDADASNTYEVVVRATSGTGARLKTADQTITVTVTDEDDEAPGVPAAPTVSSASVSSVTVAWAAPANAGPPITDYDYRYRVKTPQGSWTEVTNTPITALGATIAGLAEDTEYEVQVRATNAEGTGDWSDPPGSGSTDANAAPAFTSSATFDAAENQTAAGTVEASDSDTGDSVTGYAIQGGADQAAFSIGAASGVLTFRSAPNFEDATDDDASNTYVVVVRATSGTGARAKTADQTITVTVTDVDGEAPGVPAAPTVSSASVSSVTAAWAAPANAGPPITDYDYRYRVKTPQGSWTEVTNTPITALGATIAGLAEDTEYEVQVRATNDEGTSGWSDPGSASTDANAAPAFTSSATFDAAENQTATGTVEASDSDTGDSVTGYAIQGGADQAAFSIGAASGVLTFRSAPNFEDATDDDASNTYVVVVRATSGTGARAKTADQTITVTVTDVDGEAPGVPAAPTVSSASVSSLTAAWAAPANAGPPITDYDYRYRVKSTPGWTEVTNTTSTALSATITGLADGTEYEVQVRATNDEGTSGWSDPGSASTDANAAPAFTSSATFDAAENQTATGTVEATDSDTGDSVTGYAIQGGADQAAFSIGAASGVLTFRSAPNFEDATDDDASNTYVVVVRATSGTGARASTEDQTITVTVTDVDGEAPGVPGAPTVSAASVSSVTAAWAAPANAGPPITDYDYRYQVKSTPGWTEVTNTTITALSATITGLAEDTEYEVQVRATNDEGTSGWSDSGSASTDANAAPAFTSSATFDAAENQTAAGTVAASDSDTGDSVTGYAIQGGADQAAFSIGAASGVLTFRSAPNFEDATDADASNTYVVVVRATSGTGARASTADQTITVTVTDVDGEAPGVPGAPTVSSASVSSVTAAWAAPANAGPPITDYDYRYQVKSTPGWTEVTNTTITALSATITGLAEDTEYEVQVRATNDEGTSGWSDSGSASTDANAAPAFTSSATFSAAENQTAAGTVEATDSDTGDSVTGYAIQGGADQSAFSIGAASGVLTFRSAPNFEDATDDDASNTYVVVVRATSGTGARASTEDQTITVTVTDVDGEAPGVPAAPTVSAASVSSLTAAWAAPANAGPPITDYDYRYQVKSTPGWTEVTNTTITALSATITGLADGTEYEVQVRATNDEGTSGWSDPGSASTDANAAPAFTSSATFDAAENQTAAGTVEASDSDTGDSVTGYEIQGGADQSAFSIGAASGVLTFRSAPNFEDATDDDASNTYEVVVRATSGTGARASTEDQTITVTVTDVDGEAPGVPAAPTVSSASVSSVTAAWAAPANAGPPITDYDYRYRVKSTAPGWTEVTNTTITALSATITGLAEDTEYEVQVRATNDEGTSGWSDSGSASTDANAAPAFTSSATFDAAENQTAAGTVEASDSDTGDSVTGYAIQGGADQAAFSIGAASGVLTFRSAPNFEDATDADASNTYVVVVRATSGTGARAKTADQTITVTVTDVDGEAPGVPAAPTVSSASVSSVTAAWAAPANAGPPITDYDYRYQVKSTPGWTEVTNTTITALSATITGLAEDTEYEVQVRATNDEGTSGWSDSGSASAATTPGVTVSKTALTVTEDDTAGDSYTVVLDSRPTADVTVTVAGHSGTAVTPDPTTLTFTASNWDTAQTVTVTAGDDADTANESVSLTHSAASTDSEYQGITIAGVAVTVTDLAQVLGVGVVPGNAQLVVTWTAVDTATGYTVQWKSGSQGYNTGDRQAPVTSGSTTSYTIPGLTNGTEYTVRVIATRTGATDGAPSAEVKGTPFTTPGAPQHLSGEPGDAQVTLTWDATSSDGGSAILRYEYAIDDSGTWIDAGLDLEETVPGLTNGQQYAFEVRAVNGAGPGAAATTVATPLGMPSVPASLTVTPGDGEVFLEWTAPADDGGAPVTGYEYRYAAGTAVPEDTPWQSAGLDLEWTVTGLTNGQQYAFEVRALNSAGPGAAATPVRLEAELFSTAVLAAEGEALVVGVRRSGRLTFPAHAYIGVTDSALPGVTATDEGRDDGLGRQRLEFAAGAAEATVTVTVAFDGERRQDRVLTATLDSAELEVDGVRQPYELVTPTLVVPVTEGDAGLSVADARVQGKSSVLAFTVSLDRTRDVAVRVDYATEDGSARAGEDYTPVSGTLTIAAGGSEARVEVPVLPALHVTGERTITLRLSNAVSAVIDDGVATGVIVRESELPKAWLARFGRTASDHAAQAIARRLEAGQRETQVTVAGRRVDGLSVDGLLSGVLPSGGWRPASAVEDMATRLAAPALAASGAPFGGVGADPGTPGLRADTWGGAPGALDRESSADAGQTLRRAVLPDFGFRLPGAEEALLGTSFYVERGAQQDVGGGTWAAWGDVAATRFEGDAGGLALNGDVVTGTAGLDRQWRAVLVGLALSRSSGEGGYGTGAGTIASTLTSVHPYMQVRLGERAELWGAAGWGRGGLEITPGSGAMLEADLTNRMGALGARAVLMGAGGLEIALRSDLLWTETSSDGTAALAEAVGTASRGRLMLEGAGQIQGLGGVVRPKVEGGVRYDGGDAETGRGFEVGGGLDWARGSLTLQLSGRMLVAHADESYEEWGYSGSLVYEPGADGLGLQMRVGSSAGAAASGIQNLWALENASGLVRGGAVPFAQRFDAEVGYGIGRGTLWYPYFVADDSGQTRYGLKLSSGRTIGVGLEFGRRKSVDLGPQDAMLLRGELRF